MDEGVEVTYVDAKETQEDYYTTLRRGDSGEDVSILQQKLKSQGADISVDGKFGSATEQAVKDFQKTYGLTVDGVVGPKTWAALNSNETQVDWVKMSRSDFNTLCSIIQKYEKTVG